MLSKEQWQSLDSKPYKFEEVYCAFIDILGYKKKAELFFKNEYNLIDRLDGIFEVIELIEMLTSPLMDKSEKSIQVFSDSIIMTYPVKDNTLNSMIHDVNVIAANCSIHDLFIRGGISKGKHMDTKTHNSNFSFLASEALQKAYELEQKAKMPRILIDPILVSDFNPNDEFQIIKDNDEYITHFASQLINREGNNEKEVIAEMTEIRIRLMKENDLAVQEKYQWVLDYYYWTVQNSKGFNLENFTPFTPKVHHNFKWLSI